MGAARRCVWYTVCPTRRSYTVVLMHCDICRVSTLASERHGGGASSSSFVFLYRLGKYSAFRTHTFRAVESSVPHKEVRPVSVIFHRLFQNEQKMNDNRHVFQDGGREWKDAPLARQPPIKGGPAHPLQVKQIVLASTLETRIVLLRDHRPQTTATRGEVARTIPPPCLHPGSLLLPIRPKKAQLGTASTVFSAKQPQSDVGSPLGTMINK